MSTLRTQRSNVRFWHKADIETAPRNVRFWANSGHRDFRASRLLLTHFGSRAPNFAVMHSKSVANDPKPSFSEVGQ